MPAEILIDETGPQFDQVVELDGTDFLLDFRWNEREQRWYLDVSDNDGALILAGQKLVANWLPMRLVTNRGRPLGQMVLQDTTRAGLDPRLGDLGTRVRLIYFTAAEVAAL